MSPQEWFVLGIRLFGVWLLTKGVAYFASYVDLRFGLTGMSGDTSPNSYLYYAGCDFALAAYFLLGARHLAGICERGGVRGAEGQSHDEEIDKHDATNSGPPEDQRYNDR
ncbi:MAG: hypothetical protein ACYC6N_25055 [Pirellulaceae bacterium]